MPKTGLASLAGLLVIALLAAVSAADIGEMPGNQTPPEGVNETRGPVWLGTSGAVIASITGPTAPSAGGDIVIWVDNVSGQTDLFMYNLSTDQLQQLTDDPLEKMDPFTDGRRLVWSQNFNGQWDLNLYDFVTGSQVLLTNDTVVERYPSISGNVVIWSAENETGWQIYKLELTEGSTPPPTQPQSPSAPSSTQPQSPSAPTPTQPQPPPRPTRPA